MKALWIIGGAVVVIGVGIAVAGKKSNGEGGSGGGNGGGSGGGGADQVPEPGPDAPDVPPPRWPVDPSSGGGAPLPAGVLKAAYRRMCLDPGHVTPDDLAIILRGKALAVYLANDKTRKKISDAAVAKVVAAIARECPMAPKGVAQAAVQIGRAAGAIATDQWYASAGARAQMAARLCGLTDTAVFSTDDALMLLDIAMRARHRRRTNAQVMSELWSLCGDPANGTVLTANLSPIVAASAAISGAGY